MLNALVTGISGFVGKHLADHLREHGWQVAGFDQRAANDKQPIFIGDLEDRAALTRVFREYRPDVVFHVAGLIKSSQPEMLYKANLIGTVTLFESLLECGQQPIVMIASSSAVYGSGFGGRPISEQFKLRPLTHYAVSKLSQEMAALRYYDAFRMPVMVVRMFNLLGPGQSPNLACSAFARQIAEAEVEEGDEIVTGDLKARRDFIDVRDAVRAFELLAKEGKSGQVYNVCSGRAVRMRKCLDDMLSMSSRRLRVRVDAARVQKHDVPIQVGNAQKLTRATGWHPQIALRQSLCDLLEYWRQRVKSGLE